MRRNSACMVQTKSNCAIFEPFATLGARGFSCAVSGFAARVFGLRPNTCRPVADEMKLPVAREKKPLVPRVAFCGRRQKALKREEDTLWRLGNDVIHFHETTWEHFQAKDAVHLHLRAKHTLILCCHFLNKSSSLVIKSPFYKGREFLSPSFQLALSSPTSEDPERSPWSATRLCRYICNASVNSSCTQRPPYPGCQRLFMRGKTSGTQGTPPGH